mgnify:CR=1 FL=1
MKVKLNLHNYKVGCIVRQTGTDWKCSYLTGFSYREEEAKYVCSQVKGIILIA